MISKKVEYLTLKDIEDIYHYMQEIMDFCLENKKEEAYNTIKEAFVNYRVKIIVNENCNVFLKGKF